MDYRRLRLSVTARGLLLPCLVDYYLDISHCGVTMADQDLDITPTRWLQEKQKRRLELDMVSGDVLFFLL